MHRGFIKLWRKLQDSFFYSDSQAVHLWIHLLLESNHKKKFFMFNGKKQLCQRGQIVTGTNQLSIETGINRSKIVRLLKSFKNEQLIEQQANNKFSIITIKNYEQYQSIEHQNEQPVNNQRTTSEHPVNTNKNVKNEKNEKNNNTPISPQPKEDSFSPFIRIWNNSLEPKVVKLSDGRKSKLKTRISKDHEFIKHFEICVSYIKKNQFLSGDNARGWRADFDWLISNDTNYLKILEGKYNDRKQNSDRTKEVFTNYLSRRFDS